MDRCELTKDLLLDHLYGALDESEERALLDHLGSCEGCRGALEQARAQRGLLAEAARLSADDLTFSPPKPRRLFRGLRPFLPAAAALLLLGLGAFGYRAHERANILAHHPRVSVLGPAAVPPGTPARFLVEVRDIDGDPIRAAVTAEVQRADGRETQQALTDRSGGARLSVNSGTGSPGERMVVAFRVETPDGVTRHGSTMLVRDATRLLARVSTD
ncbi:MAG: zf-HC2 domain-containing protein, partial [Planctomycetota bacterium]